MIQVTTYSPTQINGLPVAKPIANSEFTLSYDMAGVCVPADRRAPIRDIRQHGHRELAGPGAEHGIRVVRDGQRREYHHHRADLGFHHRDGEATIRPSSPSRATRPAPKAR